MPNAQPNLLDLVLYPDPGLREVCKPVSAMNDQVDRLIDEMFYTMYDAPGIGLAAPQVAVQQRVIVVDVSEGKDQPLALINPKIIQQAGSITWEEGCLSLPGIYAKITRPNHILVEGMNREGKQIQIEASDLLAVCIQHEIDHLNGVLFVDHLSNLKRSRALQQYRKLQLQEENEEK
ncbi:MAG: peptide deformylase [Thiotrichales bacterium]|nr:peptide deformylase [Thiotrichales bacterium]